MAPKNSIKSTRSAAVPSSARSNHQSPYVAPANDQRGGSCHDLVILGPAIAEHLLDEYHEAFLFHKNSCEYGGGWEMVSRKKDLLKILLRLFAGFRWQFFYS